MGSTKFTDHVMHDFDLAKSGQVSDGTYSPPRISAAVVYARPSDGPTTPGKLDAASFDPTMTDVFRRVQARLSGGLDEAWKSTWGYDGDIEDTPDERWARQVAEMFNFTSYMGPALAYGTQDDKRGRWDVDFCYRFQWRGLGATDPAYPIVGACQHLANYLVVCRGYSAEWLGTDGLDAGPNSGAPCFGADLGGMWLPLSNSRYEIKTVEERILKKDAQAVLAPGSAFCFTGAGKHIGSVLRHELHSPIYQPMDTGVLPGGGSEDGTADHDAKGKIDFTDSSTLVGAGVLSGAQPDMAYLARLQTARPLGFAHFVVVDTSNQVRFISQALPMYEGDVGYSITRYAWSLRRFPAEGRGIWLLSIPTKRALSRLLRAPEARGKPLTSLCDALLQSVAPTTSGVPNTWDDWVKDAGMKEPPPRVGSRLGGSARASARR